MPDTTPERDRFGEPECKKNTRAFLKARKAWVADREGSGIADTGRIAWLDDGFGDDSPNLTVADVERLLERDDYAEDTRLQLAQASAKWRAQYEEQHARADRLYATLLEVLSGSWRSGHPGYPAVQSPWIAENRFQSWRAILNEPSPTPDVAHTCEEGS